jgi:hypothetical protein
MQELRVTRFEGNEIGWRISEAPVRVIRESHVRLEVTVSLAKWK